MRVELKLMTIVLVGFMFTSCATRHADIVVADFDGNKVTLGEFEKAYAKNVGGVEVAKEDSLDDYKKFLDLYVNYKMKLRDAFVRDYRDDEDLLSELNDYKEKVGIAFLEEKQIVNPGLKKLYDERSEEVRASHIMFKKGPNPDSTLKVAQAILDSIKNGKSFEEMVKKYSQDNFSKNKEGDIYWFTAGQIVPSFEEAAYATPVGEIYPEVVETKFGFHIIKVTDREKRKYKIRAKHIIVKADARRGDMVDAIPGEKPLEKIKRIREEIINGADFDSLARKYSDDPGSGSKGGDLGYFERRMMVQPFDEAVFNLKVGEVSDVIKTRFGYHIIELTDIKEYPSYDEELDKIRSLYKKTRYKKDLERYLDNLKKKFKYSLNDNLVAQLSKKENEINLSPDYINDAKFQAYKDSVIITIGSEKYTVEAFFGYLNTQSKFENKVLDKKLLADGIKDYSKDLLFKKKVQELEKTDEEFAALMNDYKNGIFIFKLQEDEVWNKVRIDTMALRKEYEQKKDSLVVEGKVDFSEIFSKDKDKIESYYEMLQNGESFDSLAAKYTERPGFKKRNGRYGFTKVSDSELAKQANALKNVGDFSNVFAVDNGWAIVKLNEKIPTRTKTFEEALPELASEYQDAETKRLGNKYINNLKEFYQPEYFYDELENAYKAEDK